MEDFKRLAAANARFARAVRNFTLFPSSPRPVTLTTQLDEALAEVEALADEPKAGKPAKAKGEAKGGKAKAAPESPTDQPQGDQDAAADAASADLLNG